MEIVVSNGHGARTKQQNKLVYRTNGHHWRPMEEQANCALDVDTQGMRTGV
jgi:hypothetical protein